MVFRVISGWHMPALLREHYCCASVLFGKMYEYSQWPCVFITLH